MTTSLVKGGSTLDYTETADWLIAKGYLPAITVMQFGAKGDGVTDDTTAINNAIAYANSLGGGVVFVPKGNYIATRIIMKSGVILRGNGFSSRLKQKTGTQPRTNSQAEGFIGLNLANDADSDNTEANNMRDIIIERLFIEGTSVEDGFQEVNALIGGQALTNITIQNCKIKGFQGDGICLYGGIFLGLERHHFDIRILYNIFDGVNYENRNAISLYDIENAEIAGNFFTRCTKSTMPGAICLEGRDATYNKYSNVRIANNRFKDIGSTGGKPPIYVYYYKQANAFDSVVIENNSFENCAGIVVGANEAIDLSQSRVGVTARNNSFKTINAIVDGSGLSRSFRIGEISKFIFEQNKFEETTYGFEIGQQFVVANSIAYNLAFKDNVFKNCAKIGGKLFDVKELDGLTLENNTYIDIGKSDNSLGVILSVNGASVAKNFRCRNEIVVSTNGRTKKYLDTCATLDALSSRFDNIQIRLSGTGAAVVADDSNKKISATNLALHTNSTYTIGSVPNNFPQGVTHFAVNTGTQPSGGGGGVIETFVMPFVDNFGFSPAFQVYRAVDGTNMLKIYQRFGNATGTGWGAWIAFTGV